MNLAINNTVVSSAGTMSNSTYSVDARGQGAACPTWNTWLRRVLGWLSALLMLLGMSDALALTASTTALNLSAMNVTVGSNIVMTATVKSVGGAAVTTGETVTFYYGSTVIGTAPMNASGVATLTSNYFGNAGTYSAGVTAKFGGNATYSASTSGAWTQITVNKASTSISFTTNPATVAAGQVVTFTATVSPATADGTVSFYNGSILLATGNVVGGVASAVTTVYTAGNYSFGAQYSGNSNYLASSQIVTKTVVKGPSVTTLASNSNPMRLGDLINLTATVAPQTSSGGIVTFKNGATVLGTAPLNQGAATLTTSASSFTAVGTHNLTASYAGNANYLASNSAALSQTVLAKTPSASVYLAGNATSTRADVAVSLYTTVATGTSVAATGSVTFYAGGTALGTAMLNAYGQAQIDNIRFSSLGTNQLTVVYAGDANYTSATSPVLALSVTQGQTSLATAITPMSGGGINAGVDETITVSVKNIAGNAIMTAAGGTVILKDGATILTTADVVNGVATMHATWWTSNARSLSYTYSGDFNFAGSTYSTNLQVAIGATTTVLSSSANTVPTGQNVTLIATVSPPIPSGTMTFYDGATVLGTAAVTNGVATLVASFGTVGNHSLSAVSSGNSGFSNSTSATLDQMVQAGTTTSTTLNSAAQVIATGSTTTLYATVRNAGGTATLTAATGTVSFYKSTTLLGTATLISGVATLSNVLFPDYGVHNLTAKYTGDTNYVSSTSAVYQQQCIVTSTTTTLAASAAMINAGQSVDFTANVTPATATGNVLFYDGGTQLGVIPLSAGVARLSRAFMSAGSHNITAQFGGSQNPGYNGSAQAAVALTVNVTPTTTKLASSVNPLVQGATTTLAATVSPTMAVGTVSFKDGNTLLGVATVNSGLAVLPTYSFNTTGAHNLTAIFSGSASFASSTSAPLSQTINSTSKVASSVMLGVTPDVGNTTTTITMNAMVSGSSPTGIVTFSDDGVVLATVAVSSGQASMTKVFSTAGLHTIAATYAGDTNNLASESNAAAVQIAAGTTTINAVDMTWTYGYDANGNRWASINPLGLETDTTFDSLNRPNRISQPPGVGSNAPTITGMAYDAAGNLVKVTDPRSLTTIHTINGLGNNSALVSPDTGNTGYTQDVAGNVLTRTDSRGKVTTYAYDAIGRLTGLSYGTGTGTVLEFDGGASPPPNSKGRLTRITDESGSTSFTYDVFGRVLSKTQLTGSKTFSVKYTWGSSGNATGKLTSVTYPSGTRVNYSYDTYGRVSAVTVNPVNVNGSGTNTGSTLSVLSGLSYKVDAIAGWTWANGTPYQRTYDSFGRLSSYPLGDPSGTGGADGLKRTLTYDAKAQITNYSHSNAAGDQSSFNQSFSYDGLGRLINQTQGGTSYGYAYDATGNRTQRVVTGVVTTNTIAVDSNALMQNGVSAVTYDSAGNLTTDAAAAYSYATSARGRSSSATIGGSVVNYLYNGMEQRVSKIGPTALVPTGAAYYVYDEAGQLIGEYDAGSVPLYETVYLGGAPVAVLKLTGAASSSSLKVNLYNVFSDHINTPRVITRSEDQAIVWRWDASEAFGASVPDQNPNGWGVFTFNQRFPGQVLDQETGNFYNWHRYYRPSVGSYAQSDPIGLNGGINTYAYVGGNPVSRVDPRGLDFFGVNPNNPAASSMDYTQAAGLSIQQSSPSFSAIVDDLLGPVPGGKSYYGGTTLPAGAVADAFRGAAALAALDCSPLLTGALLAIAEANDLYAMAGGRYQASASQDNEGNLHAWAGASVGSYGGSPSVWLGASKVIYKRNGGAGPGLVTKFIEDQRLTPGPLGINRGSSFTFNGSGMTASQYVEFNLSANKLTMPDLVPNLNFGCQTKCPWVGVQH